MASFGDLNMFLEVAETLSFAGAARKLGRSPSATGKSIARLEERLGVRLFHRTTRTVSLTSEGVFLWERARQIRDDVRDAEMVLAQAAGAPRGRLRISLPAIGYRFMAPHLAAFAAAYPEVRLDLDFDDRLVDLAREGFDAAIRSGDLGDSRLMSRKLGSYRMLACASPDYVAQSGMSKCAEAPIDHALIRYRFPGSEALQPLPLMFALDATLRSPAIVCTNMEAVLAAAVAGLGLAVLPDFLATDALGRGDLVEVFEARPDPGNMFWLIWPSNRQSAPKLRCFIDFAVKHLFQT